MHGEEPGRPATTRRCAVLAGGHGRRIGGEKPLRRLRGRTLIDHAIAAVHAAGLEPLIIAKPDTDLRGMEGDVSIIREPAEPRHPLLGVATALDWSGEPLVVCPCDMPLLPPELLATLARHPGPHVCLAPRGRLEPLVGRYSPSATDSFLAAARTSRSAREAVAALDPELIDEAALSAFGDPDSFLRGVNTASELRSIASSSPPSP